MSSQAPKGHGTAERPNPASFAMYEATRKRRRSKQHRKASAGSDIHDLNITPMLDMMTILLVFLLKSYATSSSDVNVANLSLPHSTTTLKLEEALQVMVTSEGGGLEAAILVDKKQITNLGKDLQVRAEDLPEGPSGFLIKPLYDALDHHAERLTKIEEFGGSQFNGRVAIIADKNIPYGVLFRVLYTCGRAKFGQFKLFVQKPAS